MEVDKPQAFSPEESSTQPCEMEANARPHLLKFSIENILSPEFGRAKKNVTNNVSSAQKSSSADEKSKSKSGILWPAWVYCTRYSDRPSSGPRSRRMKKKEKKGEEKRPRTAFTGDQLARLKSEFEKNRYLTEKRRQDLARDLELNESQIKIWFQNKRAKLKKAVTGGPGHLQGLAAQLKAQGLYNHTTVPPETDDEQLT